MGDRCNVAVQDKGERVYLYSHWNGYEAPEIVRKALERGAERWNDPSYLTRIIVCEFVKESVNDLTGYGISTRPQDNGYPFIIVDCDQKQVRIEADTREGFGYSPEGEARSYTFAEYAALAEATWGTLDAGREEDDEEEAATG